MKRPIRKIVSEHKAGADRVTFECGHSRILPHRAKPRKQAECIGCTPLET